MKQKKIDKSIESLEKQKREHAEKVKGYSGKNYALIEYWNKEIENFDSEIKKKKKNMII